MNKAELAFLSRLGSGLSKNSITKCSQWAEKYRVMGKPLPGLWTHTHHPWLREMQDCKDELIVGQKCAQVGFSEAALNRAFYAIDILGESVLYVLPTMTPDAKDFSAARFDPALEMSKHLNDMFSDTKNIGHKRAGSASLYVRGSKKRSHLKSLPTGVVHLDELDEMEEANVALALERPAGQTNKSVFMVSTPGIAKQGINHYFENSSQDHFFFKCPHCGRAIELTFPDCMIITGENPYTEEIKGSHLICSQCKHPLNHEAKPEFLANGYWVGQKTNMLARGFYVNQLYSCMEEPWKIARQWLLAQLNPADEVEFYNSKMGVVHEAKGARVTDTDYLDCIGNHVDGIRGRPGTVVTMGVDVGSLLHVEITEYKPSATSSNEAQARTLHAGEYKDFNDLDVLMVEYGVNHAIIDANPERRMAMKFCERFKGRARMCFYTSGHVGRSIVISNDDEMSVSVDRTSWLDQSLGRFKNKTIRLPLNLPMQYKEHIQAQVKTYRKSADGNTVAKYVHGKGVDDHFGHARNYSEIAYHVAIGNVTSSSDIKEKVI